MRTHFFRKEQLEKLKAKVSLDDISTVSATLMSKARNISYALSAKFSCHETPN